MAQLRTLPPRLTPEEYLEGEKIAEVRHEFVDGFVYAMVGTSLRHSDIKMNITAWLRSRMPTGCGLYNGDVKLMVRADTDTSFYYPDVFVSCGPREPEAHYLRDATLVVEILSPSAERTDRGEKFQAYTAMSSVTDYMLVSQDGACVEVFRRQHGWKREIYAMGDVIALDAIQHPLPVAEIYRDIPF